MQNFHFAELNIKHRGNPRNTLDLVRRAIRMGYDSVVINIDIGFFGEKIEETTETQQSTKRKRKKQKQQSEKEETEAKHEKEIVPDPFLVPESELDLASFNANGIRFRQFSRLTTSLNANSVHKLQHHPKVKLYDILAVRVSDEQLLLTLQRKGDFVDLVTLDGLDLNLERISWLYKQKIVQSCTAVGINFELTYASALQSSETRRQFFSHARKLMEITRGGHGVVISSGAEEMITLRAPYDVSNLCTIFGLPPKTGRKFISNNVKNVLLRAQTRRTIKGAVHVVDLANCDKLILPSSPVDLVGENALQKLAEIEEFRMEIKKIKILDEKTDVDFNQV